MIEFKLKKKIKLKSNKKNPNFPYRYDLIIKTDIGKSNFIIGHASNKRSVTETPEQLFSIVLEEGKECINTPNWEEFKIKHNIPRTKEAKMGFGQVCKTKQKLEKIGFSNGEILVLNKKYPYYNT